MQRDRVAEASCVARVGFDICTSRGSGEHRYETPCRSADTEPERRATSRLASELERLAGALLDTERNAFLLEPGRHLTSNHRIVDQGDDRRGHAPSRV